MGNPATKEVMEIRSRWNQDNLYLLFICAFDLLYLKPDPNPDQETNRLWNWDVAEAFVGDDFNDINRYKELRCLPTANGLTWTSIGTNLAVRRTHGVGIQASR